jgi:UDP-N-acetylmuramate: L-alanyl-gamma-D-glutamyl-meso-diaminopimelate ligase
VFQEDFARAFSSADEVIIAPVYRADLPAAERLSVDRLVADLGAGGTSARSLRGVDEIVTTLAAERRDGDVVVIMSNGGFGGIHAKILKALGR